MVGGATTSNLHVALKIAPVYDGPVFWVKDAAQEPLIAGRIMRKDKNLKTELDRQYAKMRSEYQEKQEKIMSIDEARKHKPNFFDGK